ncbi:MAG: hypothetical protein PHU94_01055, partial [Bacilli bacterium]|nr:hypothetical protein [Bacilli bacterium]
MYVFLLFFILIFTGCNQNTLHLDNVQQIKYKDIVLNKEDFLIDYLNKIDFQKCYKDSLENNNLIITTKDNVYNFSIDKTISFHNNDTCYTVTDNFLYNELEKTYKYYTNGEFYTISYSDNFEYNEKNTNIKINNTNKNFIINSQIDLYNFKINMLENNNEVDLIYSSNKISDTIIIRTDYPLDNKNIKIS